MEARIAQLEQQLKGLMIGFKTKDLSLAASIREWRGQSNAKPVLEFLTQVELYARVSNWEENDIVNIIKAKLTGEAWQFVNIRDELTDEKVRYDVLKAALVDRFSEKLPARHYYNQLHEATQGKEESPIQFLDRCRALSLKTVRKSANPNEQRVLREEAEYRLLTSFIYGLRGEAGRELRIHNPETLDQALNMATMIYNAKKMEQRQRRYDTFTVRMQDRDYTDFKESKPKWRQSNPQQPRPLARHPPERKERKGTDTRFDPRSRVSHAGSPVIWQGIVRQKGSPRPRGSSAPQTSFSGREPRHPLERSRMDPSRSGEGRPRIVHGNRNSRHKL
jgi:hypothetical protein